MDNRIVLAFMAGILLAAAQSYRIGDIRSHAAGKFKAFLSDQDVAGTISG